MHSSLASTSSVRFEKLGVDDGLSQQTVTTIFQDSKGFIWFGTQEGLNRFDGFKFKKYIHDSNNPNSISDGWITSVTEDIYGNIWIGTMSGLNVLEKQSSNIRYMPIIKDEATKSGTEEIHRVWKDINGNIWVISLGKLYQYKENMDLFQEVVLRGNNQEQQNIIAKYYDVDFGLWYLAPGNTLNLLDLTTKQISHFPLSFNFRQSDSTNNDLELEANKLFIDSSRRLWIGTKQNGVFHAKIGNLDTTTTSTRPLVLKHLNPDIYSEIFHINEDNNGTIWFSTQANGLQYLSQDNTLGTLVHDIRNPSSISSNQVNYTLEDRSGVLWVGSFNGINKWNTAHTRFDHIKVTTDKLKSLSGANITGIDSNADGSVFIATTNGFNIFDPLTKNIQQLLPEESFNSIRDKRVMSVQSVSKTEVWLGYRSQGVSRFDPTTGKFVHYPPEKGVSGKLQSGAVADIKLSKDGELYFATVGGGLHRYRRETDDFEHYQNEEKNLFSSNLLISISETNDGLLWIGAINDDVNIFNPKTKSNYLFNINPNESVGGSKRQLWSVHQDSLSNIWLGTQGGGLVYIKAEDFAIGNLTTHTLTKADGLPSNAVYSILEDNDGFLWLGTNRGLVRLQINTLDMKVYTDAQGLLSREFNSGAFHKAQNGKFYFGGLFGVTSFYPDQIIPNQTKPPVVVTSIQKLNNFYSPYELKNEKSAIEFDYTDYLVSFEFAALDFVSPRDNRYKYKLKGFDADWVNAFDSRKATYTNLPSGSYEFQVIAANSDGVWNELGYVQKVVVHPALWESPIAYIVYLCATFTGIALVMRIFYKKADAERKYRVKLEKEVQQRTRELQTLNEQLLHASETDQLTGLNNRRHLNQVLPELALKIADAFIVATEKQLVSATTGPRLFFLMFDLDGFKSINDNYGHDAGDRVIQQVASLLKDVTRADDVVIRWGGDEFLIVGECNDVDEVKALAERVRENIAKCGFNIGLSQQMHISSSLGFALYPFSLYSPDALNWDQVHLLADNALYRSKEAGRDTWTGIIQSSHQVPFSQLNGINADVQSALENGIITVVKHEPEVFKSSSLEL